MLHLTGHNTILILPLLQEIELTEALCGFQKTIEMLDNRQLVITSHPGEIIRPGKFLVNYARTLQNYLSLSYRK